VPFHCGKWYFCMLFISYIPITIQRTISPTKQFRMITIKEIIQEGAVDPFEDEVVVLGGIVVDDVGADGDVVEVEADAS
jgi:hypothetical protein